MDEYTQSKLRELETELALHTHQYESIKYRPYHVQFRLASHSTTSDVNSLVPGGSIPVTRGFWSVRLFGRYSTSATGTGIGISLVFPAGIEVTGFAKIRSAVAGTDSFHEYQILSSGSNVPSSGVESASPSVWLATVDAVVYTEGDGGPVELVIRSSSNGSQVTLHSGSILIGHRMV